MQSLRWYLNKQKRYWIIPVPFAILFLRGLFTERKRIYTMVKHVILWQLKDEFSVEEKENIKAGIKAGLEGLQGVVPGLLEIKVQTDCLASSNVDVMLDSSFEDEASLKGYAVHPAHVEVADTKVRPFTKTRACMDYEV
jgi:hypothetical protein